LFLRLQLQLSPKSSHHIPEKQGFQASPQGLTSVKLLLGEEKQFQSFKALPTQQLLFAYTNRAQAQKFGVYIAIKPVSHTVQTFQGEKKGASVICLPL